MTVLFRAYPVVPFAATAIAFNPSPSVGLATMLAAVIRNSRAFIREMVLFAVVEWTDPGPRACVPSFASVTFPSAICRSAIRPKGNFRVFDHSPSVLSGDRVRPASPRSSVTGRLSNTIIFLSFFGPTACRVLPSFPFP